MARKEEVKNVKVEKKIRQKIIIQKGGKLNSDEKLETVYSEFVESAPVAKERIKELKNEYPNYSVSYFSV